MVMLNLDYHGGKSHGHMHALLGAEEGRLLAQRKCSMNLNMQIQIFWCPPVFDAKTKPSCVKKGSECWWTMRRCNMNEMNFLKFNQKPVKCTLMQSWFFTVKTAAAHTAFIVGPKRCQERKCLFCEAIDSKFIAWNSNWHQHKRAFKTVGANNDFSNNGRNPLQMACAWWTAPAASGPSHGARNGNNLFEKQFTANWLHEIQTVTNANVWTAAKSILADTFDLLVISSNHNKQTKKAAVAVSAPFHSSSFAVWVGSNNALFMCFEQQPELERDWRELLVIPLHKSRN